MDYSEYIPVLCQAAGNFRGKSYWEKVSSVVSHHGKSVDKPMTKSDFAEGDEVVIHFDGQDFRGVVKYSEHVITTRSQSASPPVQLDRLEAAEVAANPTTTMNLLTTSRAVVNYRP